MILKESEICDYTYSNELYNFIWSKPDDPYLKRLREEYDIETKVINCKNEFDKVKTITNWVNNLWEHDSDNKPVERDPISILEEVHEGKRFRCVEYATVINGCLNALGIISRVLALKTKDAETKEFAAGHVVVEAFIKEYSKWVFIDGQVNIIPLQNDIPLNAVEFQQTLKKNRDNLNFINQRGIEINEYLDWIEQYLFYMFIWMYA